MSSQTNIATPGRRTALQAVGAAVLLLAVILFPAVANAAGSKPAPKPQLSIAIDDGATTAKVGDTMHYTIVVKDLGAEAVSGLRVTQSLPPGLTFVSADAGGVPDHAQVQWRVNLKSSRAVTLRTIMRVKATPGTLLRLASVACARTAGSTPIVCATHSDQLPAGAAAEAARNASGRDATDHHLGYWLGGAGVFAVAGSGLVLAIRRRKARTHAGIG
jgi:uncharacterized repeat protein (TIGR01451 family)